MPQHQRPQHLGPTQIDVAVPETDDFVNFGLFIHGEGRCLGGIEHLNVGRHDLHFAGGQVGVQRFRRAQLDSAGDAQHILAADRGGKLVGALVPLWMQDDLHDARSVAQVDEDDAAVVAPSVDPAGQRDIGPSVFASQVAAVVALEHCGLHSSAGMAERECAFNSYMRPDRDQTSRPEPGSAVH